MKKLIYLLLLLAGSLTWGCSTLEDDLSDCEQMRIYLDFDDPDPVSWGNYTGRRTLDDRPTNVKLYIFDMKDVCLGIHYLTTQTVYELPYKDYDSVQYIAILAEDIYNDIFPNYTKGQKLNKGVKFDTAFIRLKDAAPYYNINNISQSTVDFQMKYDKIPTLRTDNVMAPHYVYVERKVGAIRCVVLGLNKYLEKEEAALAGIKRKILNTSSRIYRPIDYTIIFGETSKSLSYEGKLMGNWTNYRLPIATNVGDTIITEFTNTFPSSTNHDSEIKIYKDSYQILKKNTTKYSASVSAGQPRTIVIDFRDIVQEQTGSGISTDEWDTVNVVANF